jgi:hypothetical protein
MPEQLDILAQNKHLSKLIEAIELLNKVIMERNMQIRTITKENENLNQKNSVLNNDNISLAKSIFELKNEIKLLNEKIEKLNEGNMCGEGYLNTNVSMVTKRLFICVNI